jgi:hypothetical protein
MIQDVQKGIIHLYARAADLSDPTYRNILREHAGVSSAADRRFSQAGFDAVMAALETALFTRVHEGNVPNPIGRHRKIRSEFYWRHRLPQEGFITSRQAHRIEELWAGLLPYIDPEKQNKSYLRAIMVRATGRQDIGSGPLTFRQAAMVIDALQDRNAYSGEGVPF